MNNVTLKPSKELLELFRLVNNTPTKRQPPTLLTAMNTLAIAPRNNALMKEISELILRYGDSCLLNNFLEIKNANHPN